MKTFFFMAGLQRSGGTVLSAILNQNPAIHSAPASPLFKMYTRLANSHEEPENLDYNRDNDIANIYYNIPYAFYASNESQFIVDRNYNWVSPLGVEIIQKFINNNVKIICPVRNIVDILASYDVIINANDDSRRNPMDQTVIATSYPDKPIADRRADFLMAPDKDIYQSINYMANIWNSEYKNIMHIVDYDELTSKPQETLNSIYNFLEIKPFKHDFNNIQDTLNIPSKSIRGINDLYKINSKLEKECIELNKILLPETINRYSGLEFWK